MLRAPALVDEVWREASYAVRGLLRTKGFAALAIATVAIGVGASAAIFTIAGGYVPERFSVTVDARILAISLGVCLTAALLSGLGPALQASRLDLSSALRASGPTTSGGPTRRRARRLLIVAELAMTLVLLIGAGLLVRSLWADVRFMQDAIDASSAVRVRRFLLTLLAAFGGLAMLLAAAGIAGVMAYVVAERTRELGIRVALGASRAHVLRDVFGEALVLAGAALVVGGLAAQVVIRLIASLLFGIGAMDIVAHAGAAIVLVIVVLIGTGLPARRAARVDPLIALRHE